jgi:hypothetical protein
LFAVRTSNALSDASLPEKSLSHGPQIRGHRQLSHK